MIDVQGIKFLFVLQLSSTPCMHFRTLSINGWILLFQQGMYKKHDKNLTFVMLIMTQLCHILNKAFFLHHIEHLEVRECFYNHRILKFPSDIYTR